MEQNKKKKTKSILSIAVLIIVTIIVLYWQLKDNYTEIIAGILDANKLWLLAAIGCIVLYWIFKAHIFYSFTKKFKSDYTYRKAFKLQLVTNFFNGITPFSSGGQPFQVYALKKQGVELTAATSIIIENFIVYQIALVTLGIISIIANSIFHFFNNASILTALVTLGFIINTLVIVGLFIIAFAKKLNKFIVNKFIKILAKVRIVKDEKKTTENWNNYVNDFHAGAKVLISDKKFFASAIFDAFLALTCEYMVPLFIFYSIGDYTSVTPIVAIITSAYVMLVGSFVPIPGGAGGLEYGFNNFYGNFITGSSLGVIMILWRVVTYYFGLIIGAIAVNMKDKEV